MQTEPSDRVLESDDYIVPGRWIEVSRYQVTIRLPETFVLLDCDDAVDFTVDNCNYVGRKNALSLIWQDSRLYELIGVRLDVFLVLRD